ncbi:MAG: hypothetical protein QM784_26135 [Polyangiaceae bacterium]
MRLLVGKGILVVPFVVTFVGQHVLAARVASRLSDMAQSVAVPLSSFVVARERFDPFAFDPTAAQLGSLQPQQQERDMPGEDSPDAQSLQSPEPYGARFSSAKRGKRVERRNPDRDGESTERALPSLRVSEATVLRLANAGRKPTGRPVPAEGARPAGIQVFGASALGLGVRDGDVLTHVSEVPVTSVGQVVALVIAARGARQKAIVGRLWRGERSYLIVVEQPYPRETTRRRTDGCSGSSSGSALPDKSLGDACFEDDPTGVVHESGSP